MVVDFGEKEDLEDKDEDEDEEDDEDDDEYMAIDSTVLEVLTLLQVFVVSTYWLTL